MRKLCSLFAVLASVALLSAPAAQAQSSGEKAQPKASTTAPAAKPAPKVADKATKVEGATAVRTAPADLKKSGEKDYDGCGHGKMAASDA